MEWRQLGERTVKCTLRDITVWHHVTSQWIYGERTRKCLKQEVCWRWGIFIHVHFWEDFLDSVFSIGQPGVEFSGQHEEDVQVTQMYWIPEQVRNNHTSRQQDILMGLQYQPFLILLWKNNLWPCVFFLWCIIRSHTVFLWCNMKGACDESVWMKSRTEHVNWTNLSTLSCSASDFNHTFSFKTPLKILPVI